MCWMRFVKELMWRSSSASLFQEQTFWREAFCSGNVKKKIHPLPCWRCPSLGKQESTLVPFEKNFSQVNLKRSITFPFVLFMLKKWPIPKFYTSVIYILSSKWTLLQLCCKYDYISPLLNYTSIMFIIWDGLIWKFLAKTKNEKTKVENQNTGNTRKIVFFFNHSMAVMWLCCVMSLLVWCW